jgi:hypothetical protein
LPQSDAESGVLYAAAVSRVPVPVMVHVGAEQGRLMSIYMPQVVLETPEFDDTGTMLAWHFRGCLSQGIANDEIYIAFA